MWKRSRGHITVNPARLKTLQPLAVSANPQLSPAAFEQHADVDPVDELGCLERIPVEAVFEPAQAGNGADPKRAALSLMDRPNAVIGHSFARSVVGYRLPAQDQ